MNAHIVLAHPEPNSFNAHLSGITLKALTELGWDCSFSDLYAMNFDPCEGPRHYSTRKDDKTFHPQTEQRFGADNETTPADVKAEMHRLLASDLLIIHFPLWWFGMPAILKGWMDRVFVYGAVYKSTMRHDTGICRGKRMIACVTTGSDQEACSPNGCEGDINLHLWPILYPFRYIGFDVLVPEVFHGVGGTAFMEGRERGLSTLDVYTERWSKALTKLSSWPAVKYNPDSDFDESKRLIPSAPVYSPFIRHLKEE